MKPFIRIQCLGLILIFLIAACAGAQENFTARAKLSTVKSAALQKVSDAELISVYSKGDLNPDGTTTAWAFVFKSTSIQRLFEVWYDDDQLVTHDTLMIKDPFIHMGLDPLWDNWMDSDSILLKSRFDGTGFLKIAFKVLCCLLFMFTC